MSMKHQYTVKDTHSKCITSIGYNSIRSEILLGCEDGFIKIFDVDDGNLVLTIKAHGGAVTCFLYWSANKMILSAGQDGIIIFWSGNAIFDKIYLESPIYCMTINLREEPYQLLCGSRKKIIMLDFDSKKISGHFLNLNSSYSTLEHTDIVKCIVYHKAKVYSAGFDQRFVIYDCLFKQIGQRSVQPAVVKDQAHEAGINQLIVAEDAESVVWICTGGFDKCVKVWSSDGKMIHKIDGFPSCITGICYIPRSRTIWITAGSWCPWIYDPKSGENVSEFCDTFINKEPQKYQLQTLTYFPKVSVVIGCTSRRNMMVWKHQHSSSISMLSFDHPVESLAYTKKDPILIFTGDHKGIIEKFENRHSNQFSYVRETIKTSFSMQNALKKKARKNGIDTNVEDLSNGTRKKARNFTKRSTILKLYYEESLDILIACSEDSNLYTFGYDEKTFDILKKINNTKGVALKDSDVNNNNEGTEGEEDSMSKVWDNRPIHIKETEEHVTKRVAGLTLRHILSSHTSVVTCFVVVHFDGHVYLTSSGWDRRICLWNLYSGRLLDTFRNVNSALWEERELAADDAILAMSYCPERNELAYSSADNMVYIRRFSNVGCEMVLLNTLQGHMADITSLIWNNYLSCWITGGEDGLVKIWEGFGLNDCKESLNVAGVVYDICVDGVSNSLLVAVGNQLKVFSLDDFTLIQCYTGHGDVIKSVIHAVEIDSYITASWDAHVNIWNACPRRNSTNRRLSVLLETDDKQLIGLDEAVENDFKLQHQTSYSELPIVA